MITEKDTIKCEAVYNEDKTHRLLWKRVWNKEKPTACVIMINPCQADTILTDTTTYLVVNNIARLGDFGGVTIVNLFSLLTPKLHFRTEIDVNDYSNDQYIKKAADEASVVILAWGKAADTNAKIYHRARQVIDLLSDQTEKLRVISDGSRVGLHPLTPSIRSEWLLTTADEWIKENDELAQKREERANQEQKKTQGSTKTTGETIAADK